MHKSAILSKDEVYRYSLVRWWAERSNGSVMAFIMLNPSTADAKIDDPTIRRCIGFAKREEAIGMCVVNLFAYRTKDPRELKQAAAETNIVGQAVSNGKNINHAFLQHPELEMPFDPEKVIYVAAWGAHANIPGFSHEVENVRAMHNDLMCLGVTKNNSPRHPLYVRADQPLIPFE